MRTALKCALFLLVVAISGCAPAGPPFASVAATLPPMAPNTARIFFYRWLEPYETMAPAIAYLNNQPVGVTETGAVLYRDVVPGQYTIKIQSEGVYPNQFKTVTLKAGDVAYVRVELLRSWSGCGGGGLGGGGGGACWDTFVVNLMDPALARAEISDLRFIQG